MEVQFGFLPKPISVRAGSIEIRPRPDFQSQADLVRHSPQVHEGWFYPPLAAHTRMEDLGEQSLPYPMRRFELPLTHAVLHRKSTDPKRLHFLIAVVGFLTGFRLLPEGFGHLHRAAVKGGLLGDLVIHPKELEVCIAKADEFWMKSDLSTRRSLEAVINVLQIAPSYPQDFEQFTFLYSGLDAVWNLYERRLGLLGGGHWKRARELCLYLRIPVPYWARKSRAKMGSKKPESGVSKLRNRLVHEALFGEHPLGYSIPEHDILLDIYGLVARALVGVLEIKCGYVRSPLNTRQQHGLELY